MDRFHFPLRIDAKLKARIAQLNTFTYIYADPKICELFVAWLRTYKSDPDLAAEVERAADPYGDEVEESTKIVNDELQDGTLFSEFKNSVSQLPEFDV